MVQMHDERSETNHHLQREGIEPRDKTVRIECAGNAMCESLFQCASREDETHGAASRSPGSHEQMIREENAKRFQTQECETENALRRAERAQRRRGSGPKKIAPE